MTDGPYTTITVDEYTRLADTLTMLRRRLQTVRELLEKGSAGEALTMLRVEPLE